MRQEPSPRPVPEEFRQPLLCNRPHTTPHQWKHRERETERDEREMGERWERDERERDGREMGERWERDGREMGVEMDTII